MIELRGVTKVFGSGTRKVTVLDGIDLTVADGEIAAVVGPSGAGKSTLSKCINLLQRPTSGQVLVDGADLTSLRGSDLRRARQSIGTIFQGSSLLARRTAAENVALPLEYLGATAASTRRRVAELLDVVGLSHRADYYPAQLSGGQKQRVGIARALALRPKVVLSDEATSGLDPASTQSILALIQQVRDEFNLSVVLITHEMDIVRQAADTVCKIEHGKLTETGTVIDVLTAADSGLARELLPPSVATPAGGGRRRWEIIYRAADVSSDWLLTVSREIGSPVGILGGIVETVSGRQIGRLSTEIDAGLSDAIVTAAFARAGLHATPATPADRAAEAPDLEPAAEFALEPAI